MGTPELQPGDVDVVAGGADDNLIFLAGLGSVSVSPEAEAPAQPPASPASIHDEARDMLAHDPLVQRAVLAAQQSGPLSVFDKDSCETVAELVSTMNAGLKQAKAIKSEARRPYAEALAAFDTGASEVLDEIESAKAAAVARMNEWRQADQVLYAQMRADMEAAAEDLRRRAAEAAEAAGLPEPPAVDIYIGPPPRSLNTGDASVTFSSRWTYEITDPTLVPREYCVPSAGLLKRAVDGGVRSIPGVRVYQKDGVTVREVK